MNIPVDISTTVLETERLILRPWRESDVDDFFEYASVDGVGQAAGWQPHKSKAESEQILSNFINEKKTFALELKENNKVIGSIGLEELCFDLGEPYTSRKGREIGYVLSKDYWGYGLMTEAVKKVIEYCFQNTGCEFLQCSHAEENIRSKRVIEKCGFSFVRNCERKTQTGAIRKSKLYVLENNIPNLNVSKWIPAQNVSNSLLDIKSIVDNLDGLTVVLEGQASELLTIKWDDTESYCCSTEESRLEFIAGQWQEIRKEFPNWSFFRFTDSPYLNWVKEQAGGFMDEVNLNHFMIISRDYVLDVISRFEPDIMEGK